MDISDTSSNPASHSSTGTNAPGVLLAAKSINKDFAEKKILENISLTIEEGQIVTLIGPKRGRQDHPSPYCPRTTPA